MSESSINSTSARNPLLVLSTVTIATLWIVTRFILLPYVIHLLLLVSCILYVACHQSLSLREEQALARGEVDPNKAENEDEADTPSPVTETLKMEDAMKFPLLGSCTLFGLYLAFKFFNKDTINLIISVYFGLIGCAAVTATGSAVLSSILGGPFTNYHLKKEIKIRHGLPAFIAGDSPWDLSFDFTLVDILSFLGSAVFTVSYLQTKRWWMNNLIGICFCLLSIEKFSLGTYKIGAILLIGLFFYDIFWVFGTDVMVTVAKSIDGPIKILFPRTLTPDPMTQKIDLSLLGLGDIVIPGFFLSLLLRFDAHKANVPYFPTNVHSSFPKPYFHSALIAYMAGMGLTMFVMIHFQAAQPALLYLVPACLGSSLLTALIRGELKELFAYSEEAEEPKEEKKVEEEKVDTSKDSTAKKDD